jgi:acylphosphatase
MGQMEQLHAIVHGRVQGVSFRYYTVLKAVDLNLKGWVRNLPDGTVEVLAEGAHEPLGQLLDFLHRGPSGASVESVDVQWGAATGDLVDFIVR